MAGKERAPHADLTAFYDVFVLGQALSELLGTAMADAPLKPSEYAVYSQVDLLPGATVSEVASATGAPLTTASHWIRRMRHRGHVACTADPRDKRAVTVLLTDEGRAALLAARERFGIAQEAFLARLPRSEGELKSVLAETIVAVRRAHEDLSRQTE